MKTNDQKNGEVRAYRAPRLITYGDMATFTTSGVASMDEGGGVGNEPRTPKP